MGGVKIQAIQLIGDKKEELLQGIAQASFLIILCDLDGTLIPFASTPEKVVIDDDLLCLLQDLSALPSTLAGVISGRPAAYLKEVLAVPCLFLAGHHGGLIIRGDNQFWLLAIEDFKPLIQKFKEELLSKISDYKGLYAEDKEVVFALHYRLAEEKTARKAKEIFIEIAEPFLKKAPLEILEGKKVIELRPKGLNKGLPINYFKKKYPEATIVYFGDDRTDEDAFAALNTSGISILVGSSFYETKAKYHLSSYQEVRIFLREVIKIRKEYGRD